MTAHVAVPDQQPCGNGCTTGHGPARTPVLCDGQARLCPACLERLDTWLRQIPETYALLPYVVEHGTVSTNPEMATTKRPDPPAPLRLEVMDLLDSRRGWQYDPVAGHPMLSDNRRGVFGVILEPAARVRLERGLDRLCDCRHSAPLHGFRVPLAAYCHAGKCPCRAWRVSTTLARECGFLIRHLPWIAVQDWAVEFYEAVKPVARELSDRVGEYRPHPVGMCVALVWNETVRTMLLCGGALYRDKAGHGVHCSKCRARTDPARLVEIGRTVGLISDDGSDETREVPA